MNYQDIFSQMVMPLCLWYRENQRILPWRENHDPYRVWVSEIMLQQTRVEAALPYYERFLAALPTVRDLANAPEEQLLKLWEGLGYYSRVRNMQKAAKVVVEEYGGVFPQDAVLLEKLPGIGDYTAGAIGSIAFNLPTPAVDGNVLRVAARLLDDDTDIMLPAVKKRVKAELSIVYPQAENRSDLTQAIMELGALVCIPGAPRCEACPLSHLCMAKAKGREKELPVRIVKKEKKTVKRTVFLLRCGDEIALSKRPKKGVLAGMWEFPSVDIHINEKQAKQQVLEWKMDGKVQAFIDSRHVFTHLIWEMKSYLVQVAEKSDAFTWVTLSNLEQSVALPSAMKPFLDAVLGNKKEL